MSSILAPATNKHEFINRKMQEMKLKNEEILKRFEEVEQDKQKYRQEQSKLQQQKQEKSVHFNTTVNYFGNDERYSTPYNNNNNPINRFYPKRKYETQSSLQHNQQSQSQSQSQQNNYYKEKIYYNDYSSVKTNHATPTPITTTTTTTQDMGPFPEFGWSTKPYIPTENFSTSNTNDNYVTPQKKFIYNNSTTSSSLSYGSFHNANNSSVNSKKDSRKKSTDKIRNKNSKSLINRNQTTTTGGDTNNDHGFFNKFQPIQQDAQINNSTSFTFRFDNSAQDHRRHSYTVNQEMKSNNNRKQSFNGFTAPTPPSPSSSSSTTTTTTTTIIPPSPAPSSSITQNRLVEQKNSKILIKIDNSQPSKVQNEQDSKNLTEFEQFTRALENLPPRLRRKRIIELQQQQQQQQQQQGNNYQNRLKSSYFDIFMNENIDTIFPQFNNQSQSYRRPNNKYQIQQQQHSLDDYNLKNLSTNNKKKSNAFDQFEEYRLDNIKTTSTTSQQQQQQQQRNYKLKSNNSNNNNNNNKTQISSSSSLSLSPINKSPRQNKYIKSTTDTISKSINESIAILEESLKPIATDSNHLLDDKHHENSNDSYESNVTGNGNESDTSKTNEKTKAYEAKDFLEWAKLYFNCHLKNNLNAESNEKLNLDNENDNEKAHIDIEQAEDDLIKNDTRQNETELFDDDDDVTCEDINSYRVTFDLTETTPEIIATTKALDNTTDLLCKLTMTEEIIMKDDNNTQIKSS